MTISNEESVSAYNTKPEAFPVERRSWMRLTNLQARKFLLTRHGLSGEHIFTGKEGVMSFIRRVGCIQFDPVDVCGRNADIVLNSRIKDYKKETLDELLYRDRRLVDYFDKNLSIFPVEDLPVFLSNMQSGTYASIFNDRGGEAVEKMEPLIRRLIEERGYISSKDVDTDETIEWYWSVISSLPRAALESMYFRGELIIHHKSGTNKSYALMKDHVPPEILNAGLPYNTLEERLAWQVKRRIGAVGMLWNKASDAWLGVDLKAADRAAAFEKLLRDGDIFEVTVDGIDTPLYVREDEREILETVLAHKSNPPRAEFVAPLDCLMWDRKLIKALFGFDYKWEIYTPKDKRKYGAYTLPILFGDSFIGRVDMSRKEKRLVVNNIWTESGEPLAGDELSEFETCLDRFTCFNECELQ